MKKTFFACVASALLISSSLYGQDLSDDILNPTNFSIGAGGTSFSIVNSVFESDLSTGVTGNTVGDIDFFNVTVEDGFQLDSITLDTFDGGGLAFIGFSQDVLGGNPAIGAEQPAFADTALGFALVGDTTLGELFDDLAGGAQGGLPGIGFDPNQSLGAGTFAFVFQNTGPNVNNFGLTFTGSAVPEPSTALAILGFGVAGLVRRRR